ncbi:hypothetical protein [Chryseobacterium sp. T16E-39]|uniref:hypothetical protein n=1 Tax=Chryseobacterium sp. T16E-39 TaxID=2015076 RepID=UPI0012F71C81|nr:hypothetical protein [Chryseobacterium sp. T16E-39]
MEKNKEIKKFDVTRFEALSSKGETLKGGFSTAFMAGKGGGILPDINANIGDCTTSNTCNTGNCVAGCGVK